MPRHEVPIWERVTVNQSEFAALLGVDRAEVARLIGQGLPTTGNLMRRRQLILRAQAIAWIEAKGAAA